MFNLNLFKLQNATNELVKITNENLNATKAISEHSSLSRQSLRKQKDQNEVSRSKIRYKHK